ncbi:MAG: hypothetical protein SCM11_20130, partial [Bacillota bacterium]|nr:hypothetical protein [Bacillota bacterium]
MPGDFIPGQSLCGPVFQVQNRWLLPSVALLCITVGAKRQAGSSLLRDNFVAHLEICRHGRMTVHLIGQP